jgi:long-subunit acyl-CoA synthetase (AMP-forming)
LTLLFQAWSSLQSTLVAVVVPEFPALQEWAKANQPSLADATHEEL